MQLIAQDLTCVRGGRTVFEGLAFELDGGAGLALAGPNGAGKTSLLRIIAGLLRPARGAITLTGGPVAEQCHYLGHANGLKRGLSAAENASFWIDYLGGAAEAGAVLERVGLGRLADIPAALLSAGQARRLALARLLAAERPLWLLDEPSVSLDADGQRTLAALIAAHLRGGGLVIAATHVPFGAALSRTLTLAPASRGAAGGPKAKRSPGTGRAQ